MIPIPPDDLFAEPFEEAKPATCRTNWHPLHPMEPPPLSVARATVSFSVVGVPLPQGSMRAFVPKGWSHAVVTHKRGPDLRQWRALVAEAAGRAGQGVVLDGAIHLTLHFRLVRPKSLPRRVTEHVKKPDLDKLVRAVKDALTGVCYVSDSQVVAVMATKHYAQRGNAPGVVVRLEEWAP